MPDHRQEHLLIISAGEHIHNTYSITVQKYDPSHVFVLVEDEILNNHKDDSEILKKRKANIKKSIAEVKNRVDSDNRREFKLVRLSELHQDVIRDTILKIRNEHRDAAFSFNVTAGTALFSTSLFLMAVWLGGNVCITRTSDSLIELKIPKMSVTELENYPNLIRVVLVLGKKVRNKNDDISDGWIKNKDILIKLGVIKSSSDRPSGSDKVNQSRDMKRLKSWDLVEEKRSGRDVLYRLTSNGIFAYNIFKEQ
ncbi:hypothetical protein [Methanoplanus endosymbiosus]|uniref:Uncharacterized protein n=1 Tax=Methanoplanus endosymbiosus TaxID=33865 RepID=A0A9E7PK46_9EURY|nr:hypothetical protein [Methanoplanus endosymbiosus]UUX91225.1 hypothetical protein L6E24_07485 [Methanoplanus endosymbiosus]